MINIDSVISFYFYDCNELQTIRNGQWKLHLPHTYRIPVEIGNDGNRGKMVEKEVPLSLYNLETDIGEQINVASQYPDII